MKHSLKTLSGSMTGQKYRWRLRSVGVVVGSVLAAGFAVPAQAAEATPPPTSPDTAIVSTASVLTAAQEAELNALDSATDHTTLTFDPVAASAVGASAEGIADYALVLQSRGWTTLSQDSVTASASDVATAIVSARAKCTGKRGYTGFHGAFWQWALNSCDTNLLITSVVAGGGGGGVAAIGALLASLGIAPAGAITAAVGGVIAAGAGPLKICQAASYGANAIYMNTFVTGGVGCWGQ